ncbi:MAG: DUF2892 domain-containing protein [Flavobacteriales bacterium]|nr:DUF2892 domain-containing protein [Flavobacteriales bacterium]
MKNNMGFTDKLIRIMAAILFALLIITKQVHGTWAWVLGLFAVVFLATSVISFCPLYLPFGINTCSKKGK